MPHSTRWEPLGVCWTFRGVVDGDELRRSNEEIFGDSRFDAMTYQLVDLTGVERFEVTTDEMIAIAALDRAAALSNPHVLVAVAASDAIVRQLSALYAEECASSPWEHRVFDTVEAAREWLERIDK